MALFSIITVTCNNLEGLLRTEESLKNQTCRDFEWIIIDGASDDGSADYLPKTQSEWLSEPDNGIYDAMNKGLERAKGKYVLFLNAGDALAAKDVLNYIKNHTDPKSALLFGDSLETDGKNEPAYKFSKMPATLKYGLFTHHQAMLYERESIGALRYNTTYKISADYDFTARFLAQNPASQYLPVPICLFESGGLSQQNAALGRTEQFEIRKALKICGPVKNRLIMIAQSLIWNFRSAFPNLYWSIKSRS